ncbi:MAG: hypothetical protein QMD85_05685, partial [Candidatus Aenigmarchaeota archaeon]|nr:hypothetical protein [Candidatus Aenigmarchaeota archaeon]
YVVCEELNKATDNDENVVYKKSATEAIKTVVDISGTPVTKERDFRKGNWLLGKDTGMDPEKFFSY